MNQLEFIDDFFTGGDLLNKHYERMAADMQFEAQNQEKNNRKREMERTQKNAQQNIVLARFLLNDRLSFVPSFDPMDCIITVATKGCTEESYRYLLRFVESVKFTFGPGRRLIHNTCLYRDCQYQQTNKQKLLDHLNRKHLKYPTGCCELCHIPLYSHTHKMDHSRQCHQPSYRTNE